MYTMNVLVATDGSKYGQWGLNRVATLPFVNPPRVTALHVLDIFAYRAAFLAPREIRRIEAHSTRTLRKAKQQLVALKLKGTVCKKQGMIAPVILKHAPKRDGLLVVGSQGLNALDRFLLGSVSTKLLHHATCPVLVVKNEAAPLRRIALAIDGSDASATALEFVLTKFQPDRAAGEGGRVPIHVSVIHVMPSIKYPKLKEAGRRLVEPSVRKLIKAGFTAEPVYQLGNPAEEIMKGASKQHADLIVMGAQGLGAIDRFLIGSVSTRVVQHANCAVLVVRAETKHHRSVLDRFPGVSSGVIG
jgi:nucleotide-binding universal stress UspA family protein